MNTPTTATDPTTSIASSVLRQSILGSRRFSNYWWATIVSLGAGGFLLAGLSSYFRMNLLPFTDSSQLVFLPQGIALSFYGVAGMLLATYLWLVTIWDVGGGYNEFNRQSGEITIFRWGYPGKNRQIELKCKTSDVQSVRVEIKDGLNPKRAIYLKIKAKRDIPLTRVGVPMSLTELENQGAELAKFLQVPLEGL